MCCWWVRCIVIPACYLAKTFRYKSYLMSFYFPDRTKRKRKILVATKGFNSFVLHEFLNFTFNGWVAYHFHYFIPFLSLIAPSMDLDSNSFFTIFPRKATGFESPLCPSDWCLLTSPSLISSTLINFSFADEYIQWSSNLTDPFVVWNISQINDINI